MYFSLNEDGDVLQGFTGAFDFVDHDTCELLTLKRTTPLKSAPIPAVPTPTASGPSAPNAGVPAATPSTVASSTAFRKWKSRDDKFTIDAELVSATDGKAVLRRADGQTIEVPMDQLSQEDQDFIEKNPK